MPKPKKGLKRRLMSKVRRLFSLHSKSATLRAVNSDSSSTPEPPKTTMTEVSSDVHHTKTRKQAPRGIRFSRRAVQRSKYLREKFGVRKTVMGFSPRVGSITEEDENEITLWRLAENAEGVISDGLAWLTNDLEDDDDDDCYDDDKKILQLWIKNNSFDDSNTNHDADDKHTSSDYDDNDAFESEDDDDEHIYNEHDSELFNDSDDDNNNDDNIDDFVDVERNDDDDMEVFKCDDDGNDDDDNKDRKDYDDNVGILEFDDNSGVTNVDNDDDNDDDDIRNTNDNVDNDDENGIRSVNNDDNDDNVYVANNTLKDSIKPVRTNLNQERMLHVKERSSVNTKISRERVDINSNNCLLYPVVDDRNPCKGREGGHQDKISIYMKTPSVIYKQDQDNVEFSNSISSETTSEQQMNTFYKYQNRSAQKPSNKVLTLGRANGFIHSTRNTQQHKNDDDDDCVLIDNNVIGDVIPESDVTSVDHHGNNTLPLKKIVTKESIEETVDSNVMTSIDHKNHSKDIPHITSVSDVSIASERDVISFDHFPNSSLREGKGNFVMTSETSPTFKAQERFKTTRTSDRRSNGDGRDVVCIENVLNSVKEEMEGIWDRISTIESDFTFARSTLNEMRTSKKHK